MTPSRRGDEEFREWFSRFTRQAASPAMMELYFRANMGMDVRPLLTSLRFPVLVLHRVGDSLVNVEHGRYLAEHTPGAKYVELEGGDHWPWFGDSDAIVEEVEEFLTGMRHVGSADRVLTNVMFTDIAHSTEQLARLGDKGLGRETQSTRCGDQATGRAVQGAGGQEHRGWLSGDFRWPCSSRAMRPSNPRSGSVSRTRGASGPSRGRVRGSPRRCEGPRSAHRCPGG